VALEGDGKSGLLWLSGSWTFIRYSMLWSDF
jgi:hypothetical protein